MSAQPTPEMAAQRRDFDSFDPYCDHLLIIDRDKGEGAAGIIAHLSPDAARAGAAAAASSTRSTNTTSRRWSNYPGEILELGRSCVDPAYRTKAAMQLMWNGITDYVLHYNIGVMFGCASFPGTDPEEHTVALSYLYHHHLAPPEYARRARCPAAMSR